MSYLYVIAHPVGLRKVGHADEPLKRLRQHQAHSGDALVGEAIFECADPKVSERSALAALADHRIMGEWFNVDFDTAADAAARATGNAALPFPQATRALKRSHAPYTYQRAEDAILARLREESPLITKTQMYRLLAEEDQFHLWIDANGGPNGRLWPESTDANLLAVRRSLVKTFDVRSRHEAERLKRRILL